MAVPYKIPKRKQPSEADNMHMQSPLSRLRDTSSPFETSWCNGSSNGKRPEQVGSLNGHIPRAGKQSTPNRLVLRDVCEARLGPGQSDKWTSSQSTGFQRPAQTPEHHPVASQRGNSPEHSKWRETHMPSTLRRSPARCQLAVNGTTKKQTESLTHKKPPHIQSSPVTSSTHKAEQRLPAASPPCFKNGWRPKRASDTLCRDKNQETGCVSPLLKTRRAEFSGDSQMSVRCSPVQSEQDSASEPSPEREVDSSSKTDDRLSVSPGDSTWRRHDSGMNGSPPQNTEKEGKGSSGSLQNQIKKTSGSPGTGPRGSVPVPAGHRSQSPDSDDPPDRPLMSWARGASTGSPRHPLSAVASVTQATQEKRFSFSRPPLRANLTDRESRPPLRANLTDRERRPPTKCLSLHLRLRRPKPTSTEPIVLSSEDEEDIDDEEECPRLKTPQQSPRQGQPTPEEHVPKQAGEKVTGSQSISEHQPGSTQPLPPIMELSFSTLHAGVVRAQANGNLVVTDDGITLPLKDSRVSSEEEGGLSVSLVASQLRGYAVWDGGLAQDGSLFQGCPGRAAPSLLFLWVSEAQANLVQTELSALHPVTLPGQACPFLLLVLREQLGDLQAALLASMLDVEAFRQGRSYDLKSPLSWADGLALIHSCPQDAHLLTLLGQSLLADPGLGTAKGSPSRTRGNHRSREPYSRLKGLLPTRLIQYPPLPSKGGITVTTEDLDCLDSGQFLNDVIIDFYLKYLLLERAPGPLAERCHVFSSFFHKQLTRRDTSLEEEAAIPARDRRHQRVRTWTRHVDIFNKDYLFVPVNHKAHWYLVVICFPGLEQAQHEEWSGLAGVEANGGKRKCQSQASTGPSPEASNPKLQNGAGGASGKPTLKPHNPPACTQDGCQRETIIKKPCILIMDSLKISYHESIYKLLRDYLHVEWEVRRGTRRDFTVDSMKASHCTVPLQNNSSDCGLYLLQYVESFLQNPVVHFDLPLRLERWFPRQQVWRKREEIRSLVMELHGCRGNGGSSRRTVVSS
uniref:SUMO specific peptidase 7b n=2 Tax=Oncorhynchus mykiss TaxID=8022 RepID=A0A8L0DM63_ONCMY